MTGQITAPSTISLELVAAIVGVSMILGAIDLARQPGWAWKPAEESKAAWFVLVALVPLVGLGMYLHTARPRVATIAAAGRAASLPFDRFRDDHFTNTTGAQREAIGRIGGVAAPERFATAGATTAQRGEVRMVEDGPSGHRGGGTRGEPTGAGGTAVRSAMAPIGLTRAYRPTQRTSLTVPSPAADVSGSATPSVPAGWKADPTGRHQFRYWGGTRWTDDVADHGEQSRDATTS